MTITQEINKIINGFDFKKVRKVMLLLKWEWALINEDKVKVPTINELKKTARRLLKMVIKSEKDNDICGTGGFEAEKIDGNWISLKFILADYDDELKVGSKRGKRKPRRDSPFIGLEL